MRYILLMVCVMLAACGDESVRQQHIRTAAKLCEPNEGTKFIKYAHSEPRIEGCGYRCAKDYGTSYYSVDATCNNGVHVMYKWEE